jgi:hypothetical protein
VHPALGPGRRCTAHPRQARRPLGRSRLEPRKQRRYRGERGPSRASRTTFSLPRGKHANSLIAGRLGFPDALGEMVSDPDTKKHVKEPRFRLAS